MGIIIKPIVTEKLTIQGEKLNRYGFIVDREANKLQIKAAVEQIYNVTVAEVNVITVDEINTYAIMNSYSMVLVDGVQDILEARIRR